MFIRLCQFFLCTAEYQVLIYLYLPRFCAYRGGIRKKYKGFDQAFYFFIVDNTAPIYIIIKKILQYRLT